jgi:CRP/FNR family transcriptional regulator, cyclic AMP receptor protein
MSAEGRQVTVRYARPGDVLGIAVLVGGPASVGVQAVEPSGLSRISLKRPGFRAHLVMRG